MPELTGAQIAAAVAIFVVSLVATSALVTAFLVKIPADHFVSTHSPLSRKFRSLGARIAYRFTKNFIGVVLVATGLVLSLPGVPGQGILTILVGIFLLDIPGKRRLELRIIKRPRIINNINRLRARFGRSPLTVEAPSDGAAPSDHAAP